MEVAYFLLLGLCLGSFTNVLISRIPSGESILGRSHCTNCREKIANRDLIPIFSWLFLNRKCRNCDSKISVMYPLVECVTALLVLSTIFLLPTSPILIGWVVFAPLSVALSVIDLKLFRLPNSLVLTAAVTALLSVLIDTLVTGAWKDFQTAIVTSLVVVIFFWTIRLISRGGMGLGDVKLAFPIGLLLGYLGWERAVLGLFIAFLLGAIVGIGLISFRGASRKTALPFGPFMLVGAWLSLGLYEKLPMQYIFYNT